MLDKFMNIVEKQDGKRYVWGFDGPDVFDCSGLIVFALRQLDILGPKEDLWSGAIMLRTDPMSVEEAYRTRGAFLAFPGHIAISMGDGERVFEARNPDMGTGYFTIHNRGWKSAGFLPELKTKEMKEMAYTGRMASPMKGRVSCEFNGYPGHAGIDIAGPVGTNVHAAYGGTVIAIGWNVLSGRTGNGIVIRNPDGEMQYYGHLSQFLVKKGQKVKQGQLIAKSGNTGRTTGPHLHFETHTRDGRLANPRVHFNHHGVVPGSTTGQGSSVGSVSYLPLLVDGKFQHRTITETQRALAKAGYYQGLIEADVGKDAVDGPVFYEAYQKFLKVRGFYKFDIDGSFKKRSVEAEQKWLKSIGEYNRKIDGSRGDYTVKGLQNALNKGKLR